MEIIIAVLATGFGLIGGMFVIWRGYQAPTDPDPSGARHKFFRRSGESVSR